MASPQAAPDDESGAKALDETANAADRTGTGPDADDATGDHVGSTVAALAEEDLEPAQRRRLLGRLLGQARLSGARGLFRPKKAVRWMTGAVADIAPHIPVRDLTTLRAHHDGLAGEELAERLIRNAARATAGVGATGGSLAAVEWVVTPMLLSAPVLLAAETVAVVAIEMKLIGELHEVYGAPIPGSQGQKAAALMQSWAHQRGVNPLVPGVGAATVLSTAARKELRERLMRRFGRNLTTLGPLLTGAFVAGFLNRRATRTLGDQVRADLRTRARPALPPG